MLFVVTLIGQSHAPLLTLFKALQNAVVLLRSLVISHYKILFDVERFWVQANVVDMVK